MKHFYGPEPLSAIEEQGRREEPRGLYAIEAADLERLKAVAKRLYTENRLNGDEMRDLAHAISAVVRVAEEMGPIP